MTGDKDRTDSEGADRTDSGRDHTHSTDGRNGDTQELPVSAPTRPRSRSSLLGRSLQVLRQQPRLFVPFLLVGLVNTVLGFVHRHDPIPTTHTERLTDGTITLEFAGYPAGIRESNILLEPVLGLTVPYLLWATLAYLVPLALLSLAGSYVITQILGIPATVRGIGMFFAFALLVDLGHRTLGSISFFQEMGLWGIPLLALWIYIFVRLFAVPAFVCTHDSLIRAIRLSSRLTSGHGVGLFGFILLFGIGNAVFVLLPVGTTLLSTSLIGTFHAAVIATFVDRYDPNFERFGAPETAIDRGSTLDLQ